MGADHAPLDELRRRALEQEQSYHLQSISALATNGSLKFGESNHAPEQKEQPMKTTVSKIILSVAASVLLVTDAGAVADMSVGEFAPRDPQPEWNITRPTAGRAAWNVREQLNLYRFVGNNPISNIDPFGLLTAVFVGGPSPADDQNSSGNPFGHAAIAFTGQGVFSFGTPEGLGSAFTDFLNSQAKYRDGTVYILNTTPEQEKAMADYLKKVKQDRPKLGRYPDNCAHRTTGALSAGGIDLTQISLASPIGMPIAVPIDNFPSDIALALRSMHALQISVPKGGTLPPKFLTGFNPK